MDQMSKEPAFLRAMRERQVPVIYKGAIQVEWCSNLSFWDRLKILCGHKLVLLFWTVTEQMPGKTHTEVLGKISMATSVDEYMREVMARKFSPVEQADQRKEK